MFKSKWWIVFASIIAVIVGNGAINVFAAGVFMKPIAKELGFGRGTISSAIFLANLMTAIALPFVGRLFDRYGVRAVLLPAITLFALSTAARALITPSTAILLILFAISGLIGAGQATTGYSKMIASRFETQRGLALGIALAGIGLGTAIVPQLSIFLLRRFGWRTGFVGLGVAIWVLAFIPVFIFFRDSVGTSEVSTKTAALQKDAPGLTLSEASKTWPFWAMFLVFFLSTVAINGSLIHVVPMLTDRGLSVMAATAALSFSGLALMGGRVISGYLMDKMFAPYIGMFFLVCAMVGLAILGLGVRGAGPVLGTILLGAGMGAEIDMLAYLVACYFGLKAFGAIHGSIFAGALVANGVGALILGYCYQFTKSYNLGLMLFEGLLLITVIVFGTVGPYRYPARKRERPAAKQAAMAR